MIGSFPDKEIDHINQIKSDNRWNNLREATRTQQHGNKPLLTSNTSGLRGVRFNKRLNKWDACIHISNKKTHLGLFITKEQAVEAYNKAAESYFGEFYVRSN
jgi:hypothetical protein